MADSAITRTRVRLDNLAVTTGIGRPSGRLYRHPVDVHPQKPLLADLPFDIDNFQALRTSHPLGSCADFLQIHADTPRPRPVSVALRPAPTKKWACAHSVVRPLQSERRVYSRNTAKSRYGTQPTVTFRPRATVPLVRLPRLSGADAEVWPRLSIAVALGATLARCNPLDYH